MLPWVADLPHLAVAVTLVPDPSLASNGGASGGTSGGASGGASGDLSWRVSFWNKEGTAALTETTTAAVDPRGAPLTIQAHFFSGLSGDDHRRLANSVGRGGPGGGAGGGTGGRNQVVLRVQIISESTGAAVRRIRRGRGTGRET